MAASRHSTSESLPRISFAVEDLAALHPYHTLILFGDPQKFFNPWTEEPADWWPYFLRWQDRIVLTPIPAGSTAQKELAALDVRTAPPNPIGLAEAMPTREAFALAPRNERESEYPDLLQRDSGRWLDSRRPPEGGIDPLLMELRFYLDPDAFTCLCACAVYPALTWPLTVHLAKVFVAPDALESSLEKLVRLPWFRHGGMPEWLRKPLVEQLEDQELTRIRQALNEFLELTEPQPRPDHLEYAGRKVPQPKPLDPLNDPVFLCFLWGKRLDKVSVKPTSALLRALFRHGHVVLGLRPAVHVAIAMLLSIIFLLLLAWFDKQTTPQRTPARGRHPSFIGASSKRRGLPRSSSPSKSRRTPPRSGPMLRMFTRSSRWI